MTTMATTHLRDLRPDPQNRRKRTPRNVAMIVDALHKVGAARSIVIDETNEVLAGNGVVEAAAEAGIERVQIVEADGDTLVAVRRRGLTPAQKRELALYDNRAAELAEWDADQLAADLTNGEDLAAFFADAELAALLGEAAPKSGQTDADDVPLERATDIRRGDLFELGTHRLLCGDCTHADDVARVLASARPLLMVTDPPYGVDYDPAWRVRAGVNHNPQKLGRVTHDDRADWTEAWRLFPGDVAYVWHAGLHASTVQDSLARIGFNVRAQIVWAKDRLALSRGDYHWQHEPCWYAVREGATGHRTDDRSQTTLWAIAARDDRGHSHGTQKPVECMARAIRNHDLADVFEPFAGSGTTMIAAEQLTRRCVAIEIEPRYVQVAIDRWEAFTGQHAIKVGDGADRPPREHA